MSGFSASQLAWASESEHVSNTGVPAGTLAASASGSILSASTTALTLAGLRIAPSPSGSCAGTVPLVRTWSTAASQAASASGLPFAAHPAGDDVEVAARQRLKEAQRVDLRGAGRGVGGQRHRVDGALAQRVHRDAGLVGARAVRPGSAPRPWRRRCRRRCTTSVGRCAYGPRPGLAGADLVVAQAGDAAGSDSSSASWRMLPTGPATALSPLRSVLPALGDQQRRRCRGRRRA